MLDFLLNNLNNIVAFVVTIILTVIFAQLARKMFAKFLAKIDDNNNLDKTNYYFIRYVIIALIYGIGFTLAIYSVPALKSIGTTLLAGAGVIALAVSFASQQALSNIVSGLFIVIFKPFRIKDRVSIKASDLQGVIEDITLRHTVIRDYENRRIIVPNSVISNEIIINSDYSDGKICKQMILGISYDSNIKKARNIIQEEAINHPLTIDNRTNEAKNDNEHIVVVRVISLGDSSINLKAFIWVKDQKDSIVLSSDLLESIKNRFDKEGISIPYPHRNIIIENKKDL